MFVLLLLLSATFAEEVSESLGKNSIRKRRETIYNAAFLSVFWSILFLLATLAFGAEFRLELASLPTLMVRMGLEIVMAYLGAELLLKAERSTVGFLRLLTIPLLLAVDIALGYHLSSLQILGVIVMFVALGLAFHHSPKGKKGAGLAILSAVLGVVTTSLYKYDITHYNSVVGEQVVVLSCVMLFFYVASERSPLGLLVKPLTGTQSLSHGVGEVLMSFAYSFAPASVIMTMKRTFALSWSILFGHTYFHEKSLKQKLYSGAILVAGLALIILPR
jgi:hypothetical protein